MIVRFVNKNYNIVRNMTFCFVYVRNAIPLGGWHLAKPRKPATRQGLAL